VFRLLGKFVKFIVYLTLFLAISITIAGISAYYYFAKDLPDIHSVKDYQPAVISEVFSANNTKIGEFWTECRIFKPYNDIPPMLVNAFIASEDARFFEHHGIDIKSIFRAALANIRAGSIAQGASTITQQITRALLLSRSKTINRKVKEAILAIRLERQLKKTDILTLYLNEIYLGNRAYGVAAAARNYFRQSLTTLSLGQMALIAGLPTAPSLYSPIKNPKKARQRQLYVLGRMIEHGFITTDQANAAASESFSIFQAGIDKTFNHPMAAYFTEYVRLKVKETYGDDALYRSGLKIHTTLDLDMQIAATTSIQHALEKLDKRHGYRGPIGHVKQADIPSHAIKLAHKFIAVHNTTMQPWPPPHNKKSLLQEELLKKEVFLPAIVTGFHRNNTEILVGNITGIIPQAHIKWAKAFSTKWLGKENGNYVKNPRKILSIGDIISVKWQQDNVFALAQTPKIQGALIAIHPQTGEIKSMVGGYSFNDSEFNRATQALRQPGSAFKPFVYAAALDKGYTFDTEIDDSPIIYHVGDNEFWSPKNYDAKHKGVVSFKTALTFSKNIPAVKISFDIGTHYIVAYARKLGLRTPLPPYFSISLGSNEVHLSELVQAYGVFANQGKRLPSTAITHIENSNGTALRLQKLSELKTPILGNEKSISKMNASLFLNEQIHTKSDQLKLNNLELNTLYGKHIPAGHVMTPQTAYLMTLLLNNVVNHGTGSAVRALKRPAAGKTGTTNGETDAWFIGFIPELVSGIWIGFDEVASIGKRITGGNTAAPIFLDFMSQVEKQFLEKKFIKPRGISSKKINELTGGSALFDFKPTQKISTDASSTDRSGTFFEMEFNEDEFNK